jgi:DNA anti-recombination protein RmuC
VKVGTLASLRWFRIAILLAIVVVAALAAIGIAAGADWLAATGILALGVALAVSTKLLYESRGEVAARLSAINARVAAVKKVAAQSRSAEGVAQRFDSLDNRLVELAEDHRDRTLELADRLDHTIDRVAEISASLEELASQLEALRPGRRHVTSTNETTSRELGLGESLSGLPRSE